MYGSIIKHEYEKYLLEKCKLAKEKIEKFDLFNTYWLFLLRYIFKYRKYYKMYLK